MQPRRQTYTVCHADVMHRGDQKRPTRSSSPAGLGTCDPPGATELKIKMASGVSGVGDAERVQDTHGFRSTTPVASSDRP